MNTITIISLSHFSVYVCCGKNIVTYIRRQWTQRLSDLLPWFWFSLLCQQSRLLWKGKSLFFLLFTSITYYSNSISVYLTKYVEYMHTGMFLYLNFLLLYIIKLYVLFVVFFFLSLYYKHSLKGLFYMLCEYVWIWTYLGTRKRIFKSFSKWLTVKLY